MANPNNYPVTLVPPILNFRPDRFESSDLKLIASGTYQVEFGTNINDHAEIWVYDTNGDIAGHTTLYASNTNLKLYTIVDNTGAYETINIDMATVLQELILDAGKYSLTVNIFRNEVGKEDGYQLAVTDISNDRTELRLTLTDANDSSIHDLYEWIVPSVPPIFAQALIDQTLGFASDVNIDEVITAHSLAAKLESINAGTLQRMSNANVTDAYLATTKKIINDVHTSALGMMASEVAGGNINIQEDDLKRFVSQATQVVLKDIIDKQLYDPHFVIS